MADSVPLKGVVLCCSSIAPDERTKLADVSEQLGAQHTFDLTSAVTHLIVGSLGTPKTQFVAKERPDIKVLLPGWLAAVNTQWMEGGEVDVQALEEEYRAPTFYDLKICLTGFDDIQERTAIAELAKANGAEYSGDLTRDVSHLIAAGPKGKKYEYAKEWKIQIVGVEWLHQSIERGLALDEACFSLDKAPTERGRGAWRREPLESVLGKRQREETTHQAPQDATRRKLRRAASEKFGSQSGALWADITSGASAQDDAVDWKDENAEPVRGGARRLQKAAVEQAGTEHADNPPEQPLQGQKSRKRPALGILASSLVYVHGFDAYKTQQLHGHLLSNGARVPTSVEELAAYSEDDQMDGFLMTPHEISDTDLPALPDTPMQRVTEWWLEECMHSKALVEPSQAFLCTPLPHTRIDGFRGLVICSTGFQPVQLLHLSRLCPLIGARYDEYLRPTRSLLLAGSPEIKEEKLNFAIQHEIPVLRSSWLLACLDANKVLPVDRHLLPAFAKHFSGRLSTLRVKQYRESESEAPENEVRPPPHTKSKKLKAQPPTKLAEFRRPRALDDSPEKSLQTPAHTSSPQRHDLPASAPLQELPAGSNGQNRRSASPRLSQPKRNTDSPTKENDIPGFDGEANGEDDSLPMPEPAEPQPNKSEHLNNAISALLAQKQASRPSPAREASNTINIPNEPRRRRRGILGRASSATSNPPGSALSNLSRASSVSGLSQSGHQEPGPATQALQQPQASQALIYEDAAVQKEREDMIRRMGGKVVQSLVREGSGVLRDIGADSGGVAGRVRRRARDARGAAQDDGW